jgi:hypothetical protein
VGDMGIRFQLAEGKAALLAGWVALHGRGYGKCTATAWRIDSGPRHGQHGRSKRGGEIVYGRVAPPAP